MYLQTCVQEMDASFYLWIESFYSYQVEFVELLEN